MTFRTLFALAPILLCAGVHSAPAAVGPLPSTDGELAGAVRKILSQDQEVRALRLGVTAQDGVITLSGKVTNLALRRSAIRLVAGQRGVLEIRDEMELAAGEPSDRTVLLRVEAELAPYVDLREPSIKVVIDHGVARAAGEVGTIGRLLFLQERLATVMGVRGVDVGAVRIETETTRNADDKVLRDGILSLLRNPLVFPVSGRIEVEVTDGDVTLRGEVPRLIDRMEAEFVAKLVGGVSQVENQLIVDPQRGRMRVREFSRN